MAISKSRSRSSRRKSKICSRTSRGGIVVAMKDLIDYVEEQLDNAKEHIRQKMGLSSMPCSVNSTSAETGLIYQNQQWKPSPGAPLPRPLFVIAALLRIKAQSNVPTPLSHFGQPLCPCSNVLGPFLWWKPQANVLPGKHSSLVKGSLLFAKNGQGTFGWAKAPWHISLHVAPGRLQCYIGKFKLGSWLDGHFIWMLEK